jgi:hypothetical protein
MFSMAVVMSLEMYATRHTYLFDAGCSLFCCIRRRRSTRQRGSVVERIQYNQASYTAYQAAALWVLACADWVVPLAFLPRAMCLRYKRLNKV